MPVSALRTIHTANNGSITNYGVMTFTGSYVPGGVPLNIASATGPLGQSPQGGKLLGFIAFSMLGYMYNLTAGNLLQIRNGVTELAAGPFPEATVVYEATHQTTN